MDNVVLYVFNIIVQLIMIVNCSADNVAATCAIFSCVTEASIACTSTHQFWMEEFCESSLTAEINMTLMFLEFS